MAAQPATTMTLATAFELGRLDAHGQADLLNRGEVSALDLVDAAIARIEHLDPTINAVSHQAFETARERARATRPNGGLAGVPYLLKDSVSYPGMPSRGGSRAFDDAPATSLYPFIARFDAQGLIPVGKSSMPEFGLLGSNEPLRYGATRNPWDLGRSTGGSSGGGAAAVAAGLTPLAHGSDAAGSIRIPASCCGLVGLKVSRGANVRARARHLIDDVLCNDGLMARSVRDVAWSFAAAHPGEGIRPVAAPIRRRLRIALVMDSPGGVAPHRDVAEAVLRTADLCASLGHEVEIARLPLDGPGFLEAFKILWAYLGADVVDYCRNRWPDRPIEDMVEPWPIGLAWWADTMDGLELEKAYGLFASIAPAIEAFFETYDMVLSPTIAEPPVMLGRLSGTRPWADLLEDMFGVIPYTPLQNATGTPAISLPLFATPAGLPVGSMFWSARGGDETLLALAYELEHAAPWASRWPACFEEAAAAAGS